MDNPIAPLDRSSLYPGSSRVKQAQGSEREKERKKFSEELEEELDEEQKRKKQDRVEIMSADTQVNEEQTNDEQTADEHDEPEPPAQRHVDLTA